MQEWVTFHGFATPVDADFGPATEIAVQLFQEANGLTASGIVDESTWDQFVAPLARALAPMQIAADDTLAKVLLRVAQQHLAQHPLELGGENRGVWVRLYMGGNEGPEWRWCAGFITFLLKQACSLLACPMPIHGSYSCDSLAYQAQMAGLYVRGTSLESGAISWAELGDTQIFLVRRTSTDWTHTGLAFAGVLDTFATIEGNTNDEGFNNGYEVCQRTRGVSEKDFIRLPV
ncbi:peptidoglycan-binding protein [candidate division KSB1 bacterium]|nr:peptidoglycan-binding protein [candidate division KSB1 bacterium]RQW11797.1 MAG: peptidoglycan-binding protein [candidate division KSB1 bacterium]